MKQRGQLIIMSGFSGSGKGTITQALLERYPQEYALSVSATTRQPREGEKDGIHYFFLSKKDFETKIQKHEFLEYACYVDNYYGTPADYVEQHLASGKNVILEIEIQGALKEKSSGCASRICYTAYRRNTGKQTAWSGHGIGRCHCIPDVKSCCRGRRL